MLVLVGLLALVAHEVVPGRRVAALEAAMVDRDAADPLTGVECRLSTPVRGEIAGQVRDKRCIVTFQRLLDAPQQFQGAGWKGKAAMKAGSR